jgi:hypothetical protein
VLEVQRQHEHTQRIALHREPVSQQQFVIVELPIGEGGPLSRLDIGSGPDADEGSLAMREVDDVELAVGGAGVVEFI